MAKSLTTNGFTSDTVGVRYAFFKICTGLVWMSWVGSAVAQTAQETAFARGVLDQFQRPSIENGREYCGYIGISPSGEIVMTPAQRGREGSCLSRAAEEGMQFIASFHTHGSYSSEYDSEVPSSDDVLGDWEEGLNGWISTPGGRIWFVDGALRIARLICDVGCVTMDANYDARETGPIAASYTLQDLLNRE
jgi:hypothetical protein